MTPILKKSLIVLTLVTVISGGLILPPKKARAIFGIGDIVFDPTNFIQTTATAGSTAVIATQATASIVQQLFEWGQTFVLAELKKRILDLMVDQIVQWVSGGGDPKFVTDWQGFLDDAGQAVVGDFAQFIGLGFLCQPFNLQVQISLFKPQRFGSRVTCTLDQIVGNIQNFVSDFRSGGWLAYAESLRPQNNYHGALLMSVDELERRRSAASGAAWSEAIAGQGFLSTKDAEGKVSTPGSVIGATLAKAVGSDLDYIINAEQLSAYVTAIADALINRLVKAGIDGIKGVSTPNAPSGGYITPPPAPGPCAGLSGSALASCLSYDQSYNNSFESAQSSMLSQVDLSLQPRLAVKDLLQESIALETQLINKLGELLACQQTSTNPIIHNAAPATQNEIDQEKDIRTDLESDLAANQSIINSLEIAKGQLMAVSSGNWATLTVTFNNISGQLDSQAANNLKTATESQRDDVKSKVQARLITVQQKINQCQSPIFP